MIKSKIGRLTLAFSFKTKLHFINPVWNLGPFSLKSQMDHPVFIVSPLIVPITRNLPLFHSNNKGADQSVNICGLVRYMPLGKGDS